MAFNTKLLHLCYYFVMSVITIIIGLIIWFVVPILANDKVRKKSHKKAIAMLCRIIGIAVIVVSVTNYIFSIF